MAGTTLEQFPVVEPRESKYELDYIIERFSAYDTK